MNGRELERTVRELAKRNGVAFREDNRGKGSHERVYYGDKFTTVKHGEIGRGLLSAMCRQLGIDKRKL